jgi:hypothetical protein
MSDPNTWILKSKTLKLKNWKDFYLHTIQSSFWHSDFAWRWKNDYDISI